MLFLIPNQALVNNRERTFLTQAVSVESLTLSVRNVNTEAWNDDDYLIVGEIGTPNAEIMQIDGSPTVGTTLTIKRPDGGTGLRYAHSADEPIYRIDYNQIRIYRATSPNGTKTLLETVDIAPNNFDTRWEDLINRTGFGFATLYNSETTGESEFSDAIPYEGLTDNALSKMISAVRSHLDEQGDNFITDEEIINALNDRQREVINSHHWTFNEIERSQSTVKDKFDYAIDEEIKTLHTVRVNSEPLKYIGRAEWERYQFDTDATSDTPTTVAVFNNTIRFYPRPSTDAATTTLTAAVTATATVIPVTQNTFKRAGYYRFTVGGEVIYATGFDVTNSEFTGCTRGMEGTIVGDHSENDVATDRNIVYSAQASPVVLKNQSDKTIVPEPAVLTYGAAAEIANGKLKDPTRGDRFEQKYQAALLDLKNNFSIKFSSQLMKIKTVEEAGRLGIRNPNDHPQNIIAP